MPKSVVHRGSLAFYDLLAAVTLLILVQGKAGLAHGFPLEVEILFGETHLTLGTLQVDWVEELAGSLHILVLNSLTAGVAVWLVDQQVAVRTVDLVVEFAKVLVPQ